MAETQDKGKRKVINRTFSLSPGDLELLEWGAEYMGTSQSDFLRSAVRSFATHLKAIERK